MPGTLPGTGVGEAKAGLSLELVAVAGCWKELGPCHPWVVLTGNQVITVSFFSLRSMMLTMALSS